MKSCASGVTLSNFTFASATATVWIARTDGTARTVYFRHRREGAAAAARALALMALLFVATLLAAALLRAPGAAAAQSGSMTFVSTGRTTATLSYAATATGTYHLRHREAGTSSWGTTVSMSAATTPATLTFSLTGLEPNASYDIEVSTNSSFPSSSTEQAGFTNRPDHLDIGLFGAAAGKFGGMTSDGTTVWVTNNDIPHHRAYAYSLSSGSVDSSKRIELWWENRFAAAAHADDDTLWVADREYDRIYAYNIGSTGTFGERQQDKEFQLSSGNYYKEPRGMWGDDTHLWISDSDADRIFAYRKTGARDPDRDITDLGGAGDIEGIWSDGTIIYAVDKEDDRIYAWDLRSGHRFTAPEFAPAGISEPTGIWGNSDTLWIVDNGTNRAVAFYPPTADTALTGLTATMTGYAVTVVDAYIAYPDGTSRTVNLRYRPNGETTWTYAMAQSTPSKRTTFTITGMLLDRTYEIEASFSVIFTGTVLSTRLETRPSHRDLGLARGNDNPRGMWSDGTTLWVANDGHGANNRIYAYTLATGDYLPDKTFSLHQGLNGDPGGVHGARGKLWVSDTRTDQILAYSIAEDGTYGAHLADLGFGTDTDDTLAGLVMPHGITATTRSPTLFAASVTQERLLGYTFDNTAATSTRDASKDCDLVTDYSHPVGLTYTNDNTIYVADRIERRIFAYDDNVSGCLDRRRALREIRLISENSDPWGIWSDGTVMYVADHGDDRIYAYHIPPRQYRDLYRVEIDHKDLGKTDVTVHLLNTGDPRDITLTYFKGDAKTEVTETSSGSPVTFNLTGLEGGAKYTAQIDGDGISPFRAFTDRAFIGFRAKHRDDVIQENLREDLIEDYQDRYPWLVSVYNAMKRESLPVKHFEDDRGAGLVISQCNEDADCVARSYEIHWDYRNSLITYIHELGHVLTLGNNKTDAEEFVAVGWMYMDEQVDPHGSCPVEELYADAIQYLVIRDDRQLNYYKDCDKVGSKPSDDDITTLGLLLTGQFDSWFNDRYEESDLPYSTRALTAYTKDYNLEELWTDINEMSHWPRRDAKWGLAHGFGGYCAKWKDPKTRNPWRVGGCVPQAPEVTTYGDGAGNVIVTWEAPEYDGGSPVTDYQVEWHGKGQDFSQAQTADVALSSSSYTLAEMTRGSAVRVSARNHNGNGRQTTVENPDVSSALVTNTAQTTSGTINYIPGRRAQAFTTGSAVGYQISGIGFDFDTITNTSAAAGHLQVTLHADSSGVPGDVLCTLEDPQSFSGSGVQEFPVAGGGGCPVLYPGTTYFAVIESTLTGTGTIKANVTSSAGQDIGSAQGWSIADKHRWRTTGATWNTRNSRSIQMEVYGKTLTRLLKRVTGFDLDGDNANPSGIWGNDDTIWVSEDGTTGKLFAYKRSDGSRDSGNDFNTLTGAGNDAPAGLCSDGTTMFVVDRADSAVYGYTLATKAYDLLKFFTLANTNTNSEGLWCNDDKVWVAEDDVTGSNAIFAYNRADSTTNRDVDFPDLDPTVDGSPLNANPRGIWSNGTTMFVVDDEDARVYAWNMSDQTRDSAKEIALHSDNADPEGLWFDGRVLWVIDDADDKVYAYDLPGARPDNTPAVGSPAVSIPSGSDLEAGVVVTADVSGITDSDGVDDAEFLYQWIRVDGSDETELEGETGPAYTVVDDDVGSHLKVRVVFDDDAGNQEYPRTSPQVGPVVDNSVIVSVTELEVAEGGSGTYTVRLNVAPGSDVVIGIGFAEGSDSDVSVGTDGVNFASTATLTFTSLDWSSPQTVTVNAAQDDDSADDTATVTHTVDNAQSDNVYDDVPIPGVAVTVVDDDSKVIVSVTELEVAEAGSGTYTVRLGQAPGSDVVIGIGFGEGSDGDVSVSTDGMNFAATGTLTFTMDDWSADQTVTVRAVSDDDSADDTATVTHTVDDGQSDNDFDGETIASVAVTVVDDDPAGVVVDCPVSVLEGGTAECEVELATPPTADVTVAVAAGGGLTVSTDGNNFAATASLAFTSVTWSTAQTVTVAAASDANSAHETETVTVSVAAGSAAEYVDAPSVTLSVVVADDDTSAGVTVTPATLSVNEGDAVMYTVVLDALPSAPVAVSVTSGDVSVVTVDAAELVFDASDWSTPQTVSVTGVADDDDMADGTATIAHAVVGGYNNGEDQSALEYAALASLDSVAVTVVDDDRPAVSVTELEVAEGGSGTYTVRLNVAPGSDVVIGIGFAEGSDSDVSVGTDGVNFASTATLTFTSLDWSSPQTVTVNAAQDDDSADDTATVTHTVDNAQSDNVYDDVPIPGVAVTVVDDDSKVIVSVTELEVAEAGSGTYTVRLGQAPGSDVVIGIGFGEGSDADVSVSTDGMNFAATGTLTFTMDDWSADQTVTVRAVSDDDSADDTATVTHTVDDGQSDNDFDGETIASVAVTVADDDPAGVVVDCPVSVLEGGTAECEVELATPPTADVTVAVAAGGGLTVSTDGNNFAATASLAFTSVTWSTDQTVTVAAASDANSAHETETVTVSVAAGSAAEYVDAPSVTLSVVVADDDTSAGVTVTPATLSVNEGDAVMYTVVLDALPSAPVAVSVTSGDVSVVTVDAAELVFDASDWSTPQTVSVTGVADDDDMADGTATIAHAVVGGYNNGEDQSALEYAALASLDSVAVTVVDDDRPAVSVTELEVAEGGSGTYTVRLNVAPGSDVVIGIGFAEGSDSDVSVGTDGVNFASTATLTFTSLDWSSPQTVTVNAAQDDDSADDTATVTHTVDNAQSDNVYDDVPIPGVAVTVVDDDSKVIVSVTELEVAEAGSGTYTVRLGQAPGSDVVIGIGFAEGSDADVSVSTDGVDFGSTATLTFSSSDWSSPQTVTVKAAGDDDSVDDVAAVTHAVDDASSDDGFDGLAVGGVAVTVTDDDPVGIVLSKTSLSVSEDGSGTYTVELASQPTGDVIVAVSVPDLESFEEVAVSTDGVNFAATDSLTFTADDWSTAQTVTATSPVDDNGADITAVIVHEVTDGSAGEYLGVESELPVSVADPDVAAVVYVCPDSVLEGLSVECTVGLSTRPTASVTVEVAVSGSLTVSSDGVNFAAAASVTFTASDSLRGLKTVTVAAAQDVDTTHGAETFAVSVAAGSAAEYPSSLSTPSADVVIADDDTSAGVAVTPATLSVHEGDAVMYTVVLDALPSAPVAVSVTSGDVSVGTVDAAELVFDASNWSTPQTVTVTGVADDADMADGTVTIAHAVVGEYNNGADQSALEYAALASLASVAVTVLDDDQPAVSVTELEVAEGGSGTYTVKLNVAPGSDVVIKVALSDDSDSDVSVMPATLTFSSSDWSAEQTVTVTAAGDDDSADDAATVTHTVSNDDSDNVYDDVPIPGVAVTVVDSATAGLTLTPTSLSLIEGGGGNGSGTYTVKLDSQPSVDVTVTITVPNLASHESVTVNPASLTFTSETWSTAKTVTVTSTADDNGADITAKILHEVATGSDAAYASVTAELPVSVQDIDSVAIVFTGPDSVLEGGSQEYSVELAAVPSANVTVEVAVSGSLTVSSDGVNFAATESVTFTPLTWNTAQTVTVAAAQDVNSVHEAEAGTVSVAAGSAAEYVSKVPAFTRTVTMADDDTSAGVTVTPATLSVHEGDAVMYTVVLDALPSAPVAVSVTPGDVSVATVDAAELVFDASNWSTAQTVSVTGVADDDMADGSVTIAHAVVAEYNNGEDQSALEYAALASLPSVAVTVVDDDVAMVNSLAMGAPSISGRARVNDTLTASVSGITDADGLSGVQFDYQWIRAISGADADISTATDQTYLLAPADEGATIKVRVSFTDQAGHSESLVSAPTEAVRAADDPGIAVTNVQVTKGHGPTATTVVSETNGYLKARVRLAWSAPVARADDVVGYRVERRTHYCLADPAAVDRLTLWTKVHEWDFEQAAALHTDDEFSVDPSQLSFVDLGAPSIYGRNDGTEYTTPPSGVALSSAESGDGAFVTILREYRIVTIRGGADPVYSSSVLVGYDHTVTGDSRIAVTLQPTELSEPDCAGTAPAIALGDIAVSAIDATSATVTVPISNADNTVVYFRYLSHAANIQGWQSRQVQVSSTTAQVTLTGLDPGTRYYVQASLDQGFDRGRNRVTTLDTLPTS